MHRAAVAGVGQLGLVGDVLGLGELLERVDQALAVVLADTVVAEIGARLGTVTCRATSITWAFPPASRRARELVLLGRLVVDRLDPGGWVVTADDYL